MSDGPQSWRSRFPLLANDPALCYLDSAAMTQVPQVVLDALVEHESARRANVQRGTYGLAEAATEAYDKARESVRRFLNAADWREVVFTGGATASINLFAYSFGERLGPGDEVLISEAEHHSNLLPWQLLRQRRGITLRVLPVTGEGRLDLSQLDAVLGRRCRLVAIAHCSNVSGAVTDVEYIVRAAKAAGAAVFVDGAQYVQHGPVDVRALGVDAYAFSGHKCFGPSGIGVLWARRELLESLPPCFAGGGMGGRVTLEGHSLADIPHRFEAGTPPVGPAVGLGAALEWMVALPWAAIREHEQRLTKRLLSALTAAGDFRVLGPTDMRARLPIVAFGMDGVHPHDLTQLLGQAGVCLRGGHHCAQPLHAALGMEASVRASLALYNSDADIDGLLEGLERARRNLR